MYARAHRQAIITPPDALAGGLVTRFCRPSAAASGQQLRVSTRRLPGASDPDQSRGCQDVCVSSSSTERVLVDAYGPDDEAVRVGFRWLVRTALELRSAECALYVSGLGNATNLGRPLSDIGDRLASDRSVRIDGLTIRLLTARTLRSIRGQAILAVWVDDEDIERIEEVSPAAVGAIPWSDSDLESWKAAWAPLDLRTDEPACEALGVANPVVEEALKDLTNHVNLSTGLAHPDDKRAAVWTFMLLRKAGESYDPGQIRAWATRHGWSMRHARELGEVSEKILLGRAVQAKGPSPWRTDIVQVWRSAASS